MPVMHFTKSVTSVSANIICAIRSKQLCLFVSSLFPILLYYVKLHYIESVPEEVFPHTTNHSWQAGSFPGVLFYSHIISIEFGPIQLLRIMNGLVP